jgi:1-acyl-sn-glycerol-3-phosphate acyltransferase
MTKKPLFFVRRALQHVSQVVILLVTKIAFQPFTCVDRSAVKPRFIKDQPYILVANHRRGPDPFIIISGLAVSTVFKITPIGFMTKNIFYDSLLRPFLWLSGAYAARNPKGSHKIFGVDGSVTLLENGFSIFIFPEGTRIYDHGRGTPHSGIIRIHKAAPQVPFILAHIEYNKGLKAWLTGNRRVVKYGLVEHPNYDSPEQVMDDVYAL